MQSCATPEQVVTIMENLRAMAAGDTDHGALACSPSERLAAARLWLEHTVGKPKEAPTVVPPGIIDFEIRTTEDALRATTAVMHAAARGDISVEVAERLAKLFETVEKREMVELSKRLDEIEEITGA